MKHGKDESSRSFWDDFVESNPGCVSILFLMAGFLGLVKVIKGEWPDDAAVWLGLIVAGLVVSVFIVSFLNMCIVLPLAKCMENLGENLESQQKELQKGQAVPEELWELLLWAAERGEFTKADLSSEFGLSEDVAGIAVGLMKSLKCVEPEPGKSGESKMRFKLSKEETLRLRKDWRFRNLASNKAVSDGGEFKEWLALQMNSKKKAEKPATAGSNQKDDEGEPASTKLDEEFWKVAAWAVNKGKFTTSDVAHEFGMGFSRAYRLISQMERLGICGEAKDEGKGYTHDILMSSKEVKSLRKKWEG